MLVTLYKMDEVSFQLIASNGFIMERNERVAAECSRCRQSLKGPLNFSVVARQTTSKTFTEVRAAR